MIRLDDEPHDPVKEIIGIVLGIIACAIISMFMSSCKTQKEVQYILQHDTLTVERIQHDSIYQKDSIHVKEWVKGDTVFIAQDRWLVKYKEQLRHDSIYIHLTDTVRVTVPVEVATPLTAWQKAKMSVGGIFLWALIFAIGLQVWRWWKGK